MRHEPGWAAWEAYVNRMLGLDSTAASGSQAHDPGDGVDRRHHSQTSYAVMVDAKYTEKKSFSLVAKTMRQYVLRAIESGKSFALPVRLVDPKARTVDDYVVLPFQDYLMLVETYREMESGHGT